MFALIFSVLISCIFLFFFSSGLSSHGELSNNFVPGLLKFFLFVCFVVVVHRYLILKLVVFCFFFLDIICEWDYFQEKQEEQVKVWP